MRAPSRAPNLQLALRRLRAARAALMGRVHRAALRRRAEWGPVWRPTRKRPRHANGVGAATSGGRPPNPPRRPRPRRRRRRRHEPPRAHHRNRPVGAAGAAGAAGVAVAAGVAGVAVATVRRGRALLSSRQCAVTGRLVRPPSPTGLASGGPPKAPSWAPPKAAATAAAARTAAPRMNGPATRAHARSAQPTGAHPLHASAHHSAFGGARRQRPARDRRTWQPGHARWRSVSVAARPIAP